jgi:hypothetical protein
VCDGNDNNCDYVLLPAEIDSDGDGFITCGTNDDCDVNDPSVNPGAQEICNDNVDNNCSGQIDEAGCICPDADNDGHQAAVCGGDDCDDSDPAINPGSTEICDSIDNNCDGAVDEGFDADGDGYGDCVDCDDNDSNVHPGAADICDGKDTDCDGFQAPTDVDSDGDGVALCANDCDDNNTAVYPGSPELCDGIDNNCDFVIPLDELDTDNDGFRICDVNADCNDSDPNIFPGSTEECDNLDNDCNGSVDESCVCTDADGDSQFSDHPLCGGQDCDNTDPTVYFGATEICTDGKDNDCDGLADFHDPDRVNCPVECVDIDGDGYFVDSSSTGIDCGPQDCNDNDPDVHPGAAEICDGKDTDCDGWKPSSDADNDGDGVAICAGDCDDGDPLRSPNIIEHPLRDNCGDGFDNDCDSLIDAGDSSCATPSCDTKSSPKDIPHFFTLLNPDDTIHPDNSTLICEKCHAADFTDPVRLACQRCHADPSDTSDPLNGITKALYPLDPPYGYGSAPNVGMHDSTVVGTEYGNWTMGEKGCVTCHNPHAQEQDNLFGNDYGMYIKEYICYDNDVTLESVEEFVELTGPSGPGSFADGEPHTANVCEMCHTRTNHHQRDGSAPGGQSHLDGLKCTHCHVHEDGFLPTNSSATSPHNTEFFNADCKLCHVSTGPGPEDIDFQAKIADATCQNCHGERTSHTSASPDASGNYTYSIMCVDCHNPMLPVEGNRKLIRPYVNFDRADGSGNVNESVIVNTTRRGSGSLGDGAPFAENLCQTCHSETAHSNVNGDGGHFTGQYCIVCHDHNKSFMLPGKTCLEENVPGVDCGE